MVIRYTWQGKNTYLGISVLVLLLSAFSATIPEENEWTKAREKDGIVVHTRDVDSVRVKEVKTTARFHTSLSLFTTIVADIENRSRWFKNCDSVQILDTMARGHFIYHMFIDAPFLIADRDLVQEMKITQDPKTRTVTITLTARPEYLPPNKNFVRIPVGHGQWVISSASENWVDIEFTYLNDPGKGIPPAFFNMFIAESPFRTMQYIHEEIKKGTYKTGFEWILD